MTAELNNATYYSYLRPQIIEGLECFGLPSGPNQLCRKVFWIHTAGIAHVHDSQSKGSNADWPLSPYPHLAVHSLLQKQPVGWLKCVMELILT